MDVVKAQEAVYAGSQVTLPGQGFYLTYDGFKIMRHPRNGFATPNVYTLEEAASEDWELYNGEDVKPEVLEETPAPWNTPSNVQNILAQPQ